MLPDWVSPWWQAACLPERWDVGGFSVPSLSVWHTFALENIGNGYLCGGPITIDDAAGLLLFASRDMAGGQRLMLRQYYRERCLHRAARRLRKADWAQLHAACTEYVETCTRTAQPWEKVEGGGSPCGTPYQWHIVRVLCADYGLDLAAAWNTPYAYARCLHDAHREALGEVHMAHPRYEALAAENIANGVDLYASGVN